MKKCIYYFPRVLSVVYVLFLSIFSFDVWGESWPLWERVVGWMIHMIPSFILIGIIYITHKKPKTGGVLFFLIGVLFTFFFHTYRMFVSFILLSVPLFIISVLFFISNFDLFTRSAERE